MKKIFLRGGALAGLAMATVVLASCNGNDAPTTTQTNVPPTTETTSSTHVVETEHEMTGIDGKTFKVSKTKDSALVTKALIASALQEAAVKENKFYAVGADAAFTYDLNFNYNSGAFEADVKGGATAAANFTIGKDAYVNYMPKQETPVTPEPAPAVQSVRNLLFGEAETTTTTGEAELSDEEKAQIAAYKQIKENLAASITTSANAKISNVKAYPSKLTNEKLSEAQIKSLTELFASLNDKEYSATASAFLYQSDLYAQYDYTYPEEVMAILPYFTSNKKKAKVVNSAPLVKEAEATTTTTTTETTTEERVTKGNIKSTLPLADMATTISTYLSLYQTESVYDLLKIAAPMVIKDKETLDKIPEKFDAEFFTEDVLAMVQNVVKALGVEITSVEDGVVKFEIAIDGEKIADVLSAINAPVNSTIVGFASTLAEVLKISVTFDMNASRLVQVKVSSEKAGSLVMLALTAFHMNLPLIVKGGFALEVNFAYDDDVKVDAPDTSDKTTWTEVPFTVLDALAKKVFERFAD